MCDWVSLAKMGIKLAAHKKEYTAITMAKPYNDSLGNFLYFNCNLDFDAIFRELN